ncbi:MAG TPA: GGDEF domain-containing protein [Terriglobales bacterium]|nr:GGDEF domain-containing protein [Terriglobales bacterium]
MISSRKIIGIALLLLLAHAMVIFMLGSSHSGPLLSDTIQLSLGCLALVSCMRASRYSDRLGRHFWQLAAVAYSIWVIAQSLGTLGNFIPYPDYVRGLINLLFCFWFGPIGMALFLDPEHEPRGMDLLLILDFVQGTIFCVAAYLYFFYVPSLSEASTDLAHSVWAPYFFGYALLALAFLLRSFFTTSVVIRKLFGRMGTFLLFSISVDALYYYGPGAGLRTGEWFDLLWSTLLVAPICAAATWHNQEPEKTDETAPFHARGLIITQLFPLLYPLLILVMFTRIAQARITLAAAVVLVSFLCSSTRLLITHQRLLRAQEALRKEATHDGLTGLWNRVAIVGILQRELLRSGRTNSTTGVILADVDRFKSINDTHGHAAGDAVLCEIANELTSAVRPYDSVGRYGGEEFLIVAPGCTEKETWELAERMRNSVANRATSGQVHKLSISLSLGFVAGASESEIESLLHAADEALYLAKRSGRNRVEPQLASACATSII